jgi:hypothetical protein
LRIWLRFNGPTEGAGESTVADEVPSVTACVGFCSGAPASVVEVIVLTQEKTIYERVVYHREAESVELFDHSRYRTVWISVGVHKPENFTKEINK